RELRKRHSAAGPEERGAHDSADERAYFAGGGRGGSLVSQCEGETDRALEETIAVNFQGVGFIQMANTGKVKIGLIGSQFQADIHATSLQSMPHEAEIVAVASPTPGNSEKFAKHFKIARAYTNYREMLKDREIEMVSICAPN